MKVASAWVLGTHTFDCMRLGASSEGEPPVVYLGNSTVSCMWISKNLVKSKESALGLLSWYLKCSRVSLVQGFSRFVGRMDNSIWAVTVKMPHASDLLSLTELLSDILSIEQSFLYRQKTGFISLLG